MKPLLLSRWILAYGAFLIVVGLLGFLSNPEKAKTALISGGTFGGLSVLWGWLTARGKLWAPTAALATTGFLALIFAWRATAGWRAVAAGQSEKLLAAVLISSMLAASILLLSVLVRSRCSRSTAVRPHSATVS